MEIAEEDEQFVLVPAQYVLDGWRLLGVGHKYLAKASRESA